LLAIYDITGSLEHIHSDDEVSFMIFGWHNAAKRPKLVSTKEADEWLRLNHVSLSTCQDPNQQRSVHVGTVQQPCNGSLTCSYMTIVDSNFPVKLKKGTDNVHIPRVFVLDEKENAYLVCCHPNVNDTTRCEYIAKLIINPAIFACQDAALKRDMDAASSGKSAGEIFGSQSQPSQTSFVLDDGNYI
jgi:hypothetical protein